jgi:hypothetical protein
MIVSLYAKQSTQVSAAANNGLQQGHSGLRSWQTLHTLQLAAVGSMQVEIPGNVELLLVLTFQTSPMVQALRPLHFPWGAGVGAMQAASH